MMIVEDHWKSASRWLIDLIDGRFSQKPQERKDVTTCVSPMKMMEIDNYDEEADEDYSFYLPKREGQETTYSDSSMTLN